jgi:hypothetical protein
MFWAYPFSIVGGSSAEFWDTWSFGACVGQRQHENGSQCVPGGVRETKGKLGISSMSWVVDDASDSPDAPLSLDGP